MSEKTVILLYASAAQPTVQYAASELARCLRRITGRVVEIKTSPRDGAWALWIHTEPGPLPALPEVAEPELDDAIAVQVEGGAGVLVGSNPRSLLLAVYRFLDAVGCSWVRPGPDGEYIPRRELASLTACLSEKAALRHRGICIEGAVSEENLLAMIDWAPKAGFNSYFIQFREAFTFFDRWYAHWSNPTLPPEPFGVEQARQIVRRAEREIKKRGMLYHAVGHGWTCEPLGIPGLGWVPQTYDLDDHTCAYLAQVNGKREIWNGIPLNTNLCYSNTAVQELLVSSIVDYAQAHPEIDYLHFWLGDDRNNQCECESCRRATPADFYVEILNRLDERMTALGLRARIVFLIYFDLLWTPAVERIQHPDRFTLMFAPITRTYSHTYAPARRLPAVPAYQRNQLRFPASIEENLAFLNGWQQIFSGDSFDFDYHLWRDHYNDPGYFQNAEILYQDIRSLKDIGLNGFLSCQAQRVFFPSGLPMAVMGRALWDEGLSLEVIARDYFQAAFGPDGEQARSYLGKLSALFDPRWLRGEQPRQSDPAAQRLAGIPSLVAEFRPLIERNLALKEPCWAQSWEYLRLHAEAVEQFARIAELIALGKQDDAQEQWGRMQDWLARMETQLQPVFDGYEFVSTMGRNLLHIEEIG